MLTGRFSRRKKGILNTWIFSYVLVLIFPVIISLVPNFLSMNTIKSEVEKSNEISMGQIKTLLDENAKEVINIGFNISTIDKVEQLALSSKVFNPVNYYNMLQVQKDFCKFMVSNKLITGIYLYFGSNKCILSNSGIYSENDIEMVSNNNLGISANQFLDLTKIDSPKEFVFLDSKQGSIENSHKYIFVKSINNQNKGSYTTTLIIQLDEKQIKKILSDYQSASGGNVFVVNSRNEFMFVEGSAIDFEKYGYDRLQNMEKIINVNINRDNFILIHIMSDLCGWQYVSMISSDLFLHKVHITRTIIYAYLIVCVTVGLLLAYMLAKKNYNPLKNLVDFMTKSMGFDGTKENNEFRFLENSLKKMLEEKLDLNERIKTATTTEYNEILQKIIKGQIQDSTEANRLCNEHGIQFQSDSFIVIIAEIMDMNHVFFEDRTDSDEERHNLVRFIIKNVFEELYSIDYKGFMTGIDGKMILLVNLHQTLDEQVDIKKVKEDVTILSRKVINFLKEKFNIYINIGISELHTSICKIHEGYSEVLDISEYLVLVGNTNGDLIIQYSDICGCSTGNLEKTNITMLKSEFERLIKEGNFSSAKNILNNIMQCYFTDGISTLQMIRCRMFGLINLFVDSFSEESAIRDSDFFEKLRPMERLLGTKTIPELQHQIKCIFQEIIIYHEQNSPGNNSINIDKVLDYINIHYSDPEFSVAAISEHFNVNISNLSAFFKGKMGEGALDYIHKIRLEKAKVLLQTDMSIKNIAPRVGYYNSLTMIRVFKRYLGITPGKYRESSL